MSLELNRFYEFGAFRLDRVERQLLRGGTAVPVASKAIEVLLALVENAGRVIERIEGGIFIAEQEAPLVYDGHQSTPHGTTVADILLTVAPRVRLYSADVFGPQGSCEVEVVLRALHWAINVWKCKVINLSLNYLPTKYLKLIQVWW